MLEILDSQQGNLRFPYNPSLEQQYSVVLCWKSWTPNINHPVLFTQDRKKEGWKSWTPNIKIKT